MIADLGSEAVPLVLEDSDAVVSVDGVPFDRLDPAAEPGTAHQVVVMRDGRPVVTPA